MSKPPSPDWNDLVDRVIYRGEWELRDIERRFGEHRITLVYDNANGELDRVEVADPPKDLSPLTLHVWRRSARAMFSSRRIGGW